MTNSTPCPNNVKLKWKIADKSNSTSDLDEIFILNVLQYTKVNNSHLDHSYNYIGYKSYDNIALPCDDIVILFGKALNTYPLTRTTIINIITQPK